MSLRVVMMGTGGFALPTFRALLESRHIAVGLITQPDRSGPGHHHHRNPLKELAVEREITLFQPASANRPDAIDALRALSPDICLVAAYGQILSAELIEMPRKGAINVHASLLPKYRGAAPIQAAILNGETQTGVTIFQIEPKLDAGPILAMQATPIGEKETAGELEARLAVLGAALAVSVLEELDAGSLVPIVQDKSLATRAPRLKKESGLIDWSKTPRQIDWHVRAMQPWPMAYSTLVAGPAPEGAAEPQHLRCMILEVAVPTAAGNLEQSLSPGTVLTADRKTLAVQTGEGPIEIVRLRPEGKRTMTAAEFLRGHKVSAGDQFEPGR